MKLFHNKYNEYKKTGLICYWVNLNSSKISVEMLDEYEFILETAVIIGVHLKNCSKHYIFNTKKETKILRKLYSVCYQNIHQVIQQPLFLFNKFC